MRINRKQVKQYTVSLYKMGEKQFTITARDKKVEWYPIIGTQVEAVYAMNRIMSCLRHNRDFLVTKEGDRLGERVVTDPQVIEQMLADRETNKEINKMRKNISDLIDEA